MLFCCLWRNVETSCHKHVVVVFRHQQTPPFATSDKCHNIPRSGGAVLITPGCRSVDSTRLSQIQAQNRDFCLPLHSTPPLRGSPSEYCHDFWYGKSRMVWLPDGEIFLKIYVFVSIDLTTVTDRQTHRHRMTA